MRSIYTCILLFFTIINSSKSQPTMNNKHKEEKKIIKLDGIIQQVKNIHKKHLYVQYLSITISKNKWIDYGILSFERFSTNSPFTDSLNQEDRVVLTTALHYIKKHSPNKYIPLYSISKLYELVVVFKKDISAARTVEIMKSFNIAFNEGMDSSKGRLYFDKTGSKYLANFNSDNERKAFQEKIKQFSEIYEVYIPDWRIQKD